MALSGSVCSCGSSRGSATAALRAGARLQQVGQIAGNRSSFDVRNYGFTSLSDLFKSLENFKLERREDNQYWVKRVR